MQGMICGESDLTSQREGIIANGVLNYMSM